MLIGRALVHEPKALLLDEPSTSLDLFAQHELRETVRGLAQSGIGILLVTHQLSDIIPEIDRIILMREGRVIAEARNAKRSMLFFKRIVRNRSRTGGARRLLSPLVMDPSFPKNPWL